MTIRTKSLTSASELILGVARTGAKFTPCNHKQTGNRVFDAISAGDMIQVEAENIEAEMKDLYGMDVRYIHEHARNPESREQTTDLDVYRTVSRIARKVAPDAILSFGGSRNGREVGAAIERDGEIARVAQAGFSLSEGGAPFVTTQAAIELQIVTDMENQGYIKIFPDDGRYTVLRPLEDYVPSGDIEVAKLAVHSTDGGGNYGPSSAAIQFETLKWTIEARERLGLPYEVEWVQEARSSFLTWYLANGLKKNVRQIGRLNITLLFGFSPRLPFPETYTDFRRLVKKAKAIADPVEGGNDTPLAISVSVGAAVLPQHAARHLRPVDVGPLAGTPLGPMDRIAVYASQPDADVDILRVGLEDTPFVLDPSGRPLPATNSELVHRARRIIDQHGVAPVTATAKLAQFSRA